MKREEARESDGESGTETNVEASAAKPENEKRGDTG